MDRKNIAADLAHTIEVQFRSTVNGLILVDDHEIYRPRLTPTDQPLPAAIRNFACDIANNQAMGMQETFAQDELQLLLRCLQVVDTSIATCIGKTEGVYPLIEKVQGMLDPVICKGCGAVINASHPEAHDGHEDEDESDNECLGHPCGPFDPMGQTVFCDGSCRTGRG